MAKNKGQNNANNAKPAGMTTEMTDKTTMQAQNKADNKKGSTNKTKTSGTQG